MYQVTASNTRFIARVLIAAIFIFTATLTLTVWNLTSRPSNGKRKAKSYFTRLKMLAIIWVVKLTASVCILHQVAYYKC